MNKDEILAMSRKENGLTDERGRMIEMQAANFSMTVLVLLWFLLTHLAPLDDAAKYSMGLLVTATCFSSHSYQFVRNRTKTVVFFTVLFFIAAAFFLFAFLSRVVHIF